MCQTLGLKLATQMVNVRLSRSLEDDNSESNKCSKMAKKKKTTELPVFAKMLEMT